MVIIYADGHESFCNVPCHSLAFFKAFANYLRFKIGRYSLYNDYVKFFALFIININIAK